MTDPLPTHTALSPGSENHSDPDKTRDPSSSQPEGAVPVAFLSPCSAAAAAKSLQSCPTLCNPMDCNPPGSPSLGFCRQEHWSGLPFPSPMRESEVAQSCPTLSDPMDYSLPGSSIHGIFQARVLEWGAIAFSSTCSQPWKYLSVKPSSITPFHGTFPFPLRL